MEKAFLFETILFYHEAPCYYQVFASGPGYVWKPTAHHYYRNIIFPTFEVLLEQDQWVVAGDADQNIKMEIVTEMTKKLRQVAATSMPALT